MTSISYFIKLSFRNLFKRKSFSIINIAGLTIGITASIFILLYVRYETSFDNHNPQAGNIYRIVEKQKQDGVIYAAAPQPLSVTLNRDFPEVEHAVGISNLTSDILVAEARYPQVSLAMTEKEFFTMFNFPLIMGDSDRVFRDANGAVITQSFAESVFGNADPLGKTMEIHGNSFEIRGICKNMPSNSLFPFDVMVSDLFRYKMLPNWDDRWWNGGLFTFVTFVNQQVPANFEDMLLNMQQKYYPDYLLNRHEHLVMPFKNSHLNPVILGDLKPAVSLLYMWILGSIAIAILIIACINFINISIAMATKRHVETGIKKVIGANTRFLIRSFLFEMGMLVFIGLVLSMLLIKTLFPYFNQLIDKDITLSFTDPMLWSGLILFGLLAIILSGLYPALYLSRPSPMQVFRTKGLNSRGNSTFQKSVVVLQFVITIALGTGLMFMFKQVNYMQNHELGFDKENLLILSARATGQNKAEQLKNTDLFIEKVKPYQARYQFSKASVTEFVPGFGYWNNFKVYPEGNFHDIGLELTSAAVDENFADVFKREMTMGRFFSGEIASDDNTLIINEAAFKKFGWKDIENKYIGFHDKNNRVPVIGVINDIHISSLQHPIEPMIYRFGAKNNYPGFITFRVNPEQKPETINFFKSQWNQLFPEIPFESKWITDQFEAAYGEEKKLMSIMGIFAGLALFLSLLGIVALSVLFSERRIKEIGIRKVNGAKVREILVMLNGNFAQWIIIAFVVACPITWFAIRKWLENFAYKTPMHIWIFFLSGSIAMAIALLAVSWQSYRAANRNPVDALRYE